MTIKVTGVEVFKYRATDAKYKQINKTRVRTFYYLLQYISTYIHSMHIMQLRCPLLNC